VPRILPVIPHKDYKDWVYKILGYLIGDGCITRKSVSFSNLDLRIIDEIRSFLPASVSIKHISKGDYRISGNGGYKSNPIINLLRYTKLFGCNSYKKYIPTIVFSSSKHKSAMFLSRLFSCDGWVDDKGVGYASVSHELITNVQTLLLTFGIPSRIRAKKNNNWGTNSTRTEDRIDYELVIRKYSDLVRFSKTIGIFSKQEKLDNLVVSMKDKNQKENRDTIPINIEYLLDKLPRKEKYNNIQGTKWVYEDNTKYKLYREARGKTITREKAKELGDVFKDNKLIELSNSDILWDKITEITSNGEKQCFDLSIKNTHNFVANNFFAHNTSTCAYDVALRLLGIHPVKERNRLNKPIRMVSKVVPQDENDEQNQQYIELRRILAPTGLISKKITARSKIMGVKNVYGGADNQIEFMASTQELDAFMSVQRSAYYQDEEIERIKYDECCIRLLKEGGDVSISLTPAKGLDWTYDSIWRRAKKIFRSKIVADKFGYQREEVHDTKADIECFCWATDDNPVMDKETIERIFEGIDDPDELAMRRYGVFKQVSGRIYKVFDDKLHVVPFDNVFNAALFREYWHYRIIDFHPAKPWYISYIAISPQNEWFVWNEIKAKHDNKVTLEIRDEIKAQSLLSEDEEFNRCTLIDPLANTQQGNTGFTTFQDLSMGEDGLRRLTPADTKNSEGRMVVRTRLKNALICGTPGNNINKNSLTDTRFGVYMPTMWILDNCRGHIEHLKSWRYVDYKQEHVKAVKTVKRESQKFSDYCRNLEFLGCLNPAYYIKQQVYWEPSRLFRGRRNE